MRHRVKKTAKLGVKSDHRGLLLRNLATSLVEHGRVETSESKAAAVRPFIDRIISNAKNKPNDREAVRYLKSELLTETAQKKVLGELKTKYADRTSGFTRTTPLGQRPGDGTVKVILELV